MRADPGEGRTTSDDGRSRSILSMEECLNNESIRTLAAVAMRPKARSSDIQASDRKSPVEDVRKGIPIGVDKQ